MIQRRVTCHNAGLITLNYEKRGVLHVKKIIGKTVFVSYMKLHIVGTANRRISNIEPQNVEG